MKGAGAGWTCDIRACTDSFNSTCTWSFGERAGYLCAACCSLFFFQAEDGIRDVAVTGVQTCALPISDFLCRVIETVIAEGATTINVPDTVGYAIPELYGAFIKNLRERVPNSDKAVWRDRKSTRLNSSHGYISYAVFCLKKKKPHRRTV